MITGILRFAKSSSGVEAGFLAAGLTVAILAAAQAVVTLLSWLIFGI